jgi:septal ring factor EnvC (AmiA/AmiB activator)
VLVFPAIATAVIAYRMASASDPGGSDVERMRTEIAQLRAEIASLRASDPGSSEAKRMRTEIAELRVEIASLRAGVGQLQDNVYAAERRLADLHEPKILPLRK